MSKDIKPFNLFSSPDGQDVVPKLLYLYKPMAYTAFAAGTIDVVLYSKPKGYLPMLGRYIHFTWPLFTATTAFVLTTSMAASIRKKDDKMNWFYGGASAGSIFGVWKKTGIGGLTVAFVCGMIGMGFKYANIKGWELLPECNPEVGNFRSVNQDWTLTAHRPGNWVTEPPKN